MVKIGEIPNKRHYERFAYSKNVLGATVDGKGGNRVQKFEGTFQDISSGGASLLTDVHFENNQFVNLHIENVGDVSGQVRRTYGNVVAVEFKVDESQSKQISEEIQKFRKTIDLLQKYRPDGRGAISLFSLAVKTRLRC